VLARQWSALQFQGSGSPANTIGLTRADDVRRPANCGVSPIADAPVRGHYSYVANRILIVDDSPRFRALAAELLALRGFEVLEEAADGEQAMAAVAGSCPDGILLDVNLPGQDGFAVAASLAAVCAGARIVLTSADIGQVPAEVMKTCAAIAFVAKQELAVADFRTLFSP